eukprot:Nitzschia sp. Nitz4//scaffold3_size479765//375093//376886//NITZ4_000158-RA/size479765-processed-gene-1.485-mRNA-1//1//CDS//3329550932//7755//frame0
MGDTSSDDESREEERRKRRHKKRRHERSSKRHRDDSSDGSDDESDDDRKSSKRRRHKKSSRRKHRRHESRRRRRRYSSSSSSESSDDEPQEKKVVNQKLMAKLSARGETLEERNERRAQKRAAKIQARFGYTAEENPFNDPNLHERFTWTKKKEKAPTEADNADTLQEIETIRRRRKERDAERDEMERLRAEESRMKELENYDEWARKEEEFHLEQQRKRSAIRLVAGREKPIDVLAKNLLLFGLTDEEKNHRAAVKYQERYNALDQLDKLQAEVEEPYKLIKVLTLDELQELLVDINAFRMLEKEGMQSGESKTSILLYWDALHLVVTSEIEFVQNGGSESAAAKKAESINEIFVGQSRQALVKMQEEINAKLAGKDGGVDNRGYWLQVQSQLRVYLAKTDLADLHSKMLVRQVERLEKRKKEESQQDDEPEQSQKEVASMVPKNVEPDFGNREDELGAADEVALSTTKAYSWQDRYAPRKPKYFNRVKTGYDWNKYNQTHYDHDNPPPKTVQGYKFNIFYPDLVDPTKTPQYFLEPADSNNFCILRFHAGPPYEDVAFRIVNREWNRSRKRGFKCTFERGILSLYFNFTTHWYRR